MTGGCGYSVTTIMMEPVEIGGGRLVERFRGGGKGERNGRQHDDHRLDIVLVFVTKISYIYCPPFLLPLAWLSHLKIEESGEVQRPGWDCPPRQ